MTLPEAIVYLLATSNHGMKADTFARLINEKGLYQRKDKQPVSSGIKCKTMCLTQIQRPLPKLKPHLPLSEVLLGQHCAVYPPSRNRGKRHHPAYRPLWSHCV